MIKKLILFLKGYKKIDELSGLWKHSYQNPNGKDTSIMSYSVYAIYYNEKKDKYKLILSGFEPHKHYLNTNLNILIDSLNFKIDEINYTETTQDYFVEKSVILNHVMSNFNEVKTYGDDDSIIVLKFDLQNNKSYIMGFKDENPTLKEIVLSFKDSDLFPKTAEIYEEIDNIIITSEGYFIATEKKNLSKLNKEDNE